ncbi:predicted protein [Histoplasma mississippiense (nom. inval.)]|nr:predicted protein [Histoplasma mississippiense (nom. inval.)]EDN09018.1 predicted protein [Histoplasma mississippiense (nom. inval.)]
MFRTSELTKTESLVMELIERLPVFLQSSEQQSFRKGMDLAPVVDSQ